MRSELPLQVLGLMSPILSWVEGLEGLSLPSTWVVDHLPFEKREQAWLIRELPTYSADNVDEIIQFSRNAPGRPFRPAGTGPRSFPRPELSPPEMYDLAKVFDVLCEYFFVWNGGTVCVRQGRMEDLHELSLRFPVGHLIRHDHARAVSRGWISEERALALPEQVNLLPSNSYPLRTVVRSGLTEGHLHLTGVTSAEESWADTLLKQLTADALQGFQATEKRLLLLSRYTGRLLAFCLLAIELDHRGVPLPFPLLDYLDALYFARNGFEDVTARRRLRRHYQTETREALRHVRLPRHLEWLLHWIDPAAARLHSTLRSTEGITFPSPVGIVHRTGLLERLHLQAHRTLVRLEGETEREVAQRYLLQQVLFRYLVFRTHHWQLANQYGKTTGLRHFKRFYEARQREPIGMDDVEYKGLVMDRLRRWRGLRVLEGRISPPRRGVRDLEPWVSSFAQKAQSGRLKKFGMVVHFIKEDMGRFEERATREGYPSLRHGTIRRVTRENAFALYRLLSKPHWTVPFVVGIDAANLELTTPPEVHAPAFRFLRDLPIEPRKPADPSSDRLHIYPYVRDLVERRRLGMTYHVGEDFRHLLSGLRAIDEVLRFLRAHPGDRLGHAIALGIDPEVWAGQLGFQAVVPKLEWLDTLVWVHHLLGPGDDLAGELALEDTIQRLAWEVYHPDPADEEGRSRRGLHDDGRKPPPDLSPLTLYDAWLLRQLDPYSVDVAELDRGRLVLCNRWSDSPQRRRWYAIQRDVQGKVRREVGSPHAYQIVKRYWFGRSVRVQGAKLHLCDMHDKRDLWIELCRKVQRRMVEEVHTRQVVVEVNPSVNRVIGAMERLEQHPVFQLTLDEEKRLKREVRVTVNTDNPAVFNTSLAHEYYLLGEILLRDKVPEPAVVQWLEWLRDNGREYSFVRQLPDPDEPEMKALLDAVRNARPAVRSVRGKEKKYEVFWQQQARLIGGRWGLDDR